MSERMTSADVAFLHREGRTAPQHVGALAILEPPPAGFDYDRLVRLIEERISLAPRYRQKVRMVPGHLANPVWIDDPDFDITYHVRRSALPRPGEDAQLLEFCARIQSRLLDRSRPLWETYLVEGLTGGRLAIVTKTHAAVVGERDGIDLAQVILDAAPTPRRTVEPIWMPAPEPSSLQLLAEAARGIVRRPIELTDAARAAGRDLGKSAARASALAGGLMTVATAALRRPADSPLHAQLSEQRRLAIARSDLADYRQVRAAFGGTVNDVVLATVAGALRGWLLSRGMPLRAATSVRALVPVGVLDDPDLAGTLEPRFGGSSSRSGVIRPLLIDLPVGEPDPILRLAQLRYAMATHKATGRAISADRLTDLTGFAPPTMLAMATRASTELTRRLFSLVITNVPGPQFPLFAAGARMRETFPIVPLGPGQAVSIAVASYDGGVYYGVNGDRNSMPDAGLLAGLIEESLAELSAAVQIRPGPSAAAVPTRSASHAASQAASQPAEVRARRRGPRDRRPGSIRSRPVEPS
ncbi:wax ester/triacylglycerol synthase family O-acyltransferase [uncultured Jatrophihabitans sp.]|uniref:WS/DGAT/MGAT family O-acyltransferase n=1 Tax=uncultured Jatrophihabitans sp. TaxID=1610747 RepID=UPI0035CC3CAC